MPFFYKIKEHRKRGWREKEREKNKKSKQQIVIERYEILQKAKKLKEKGIKYKDMEEILGVKERTLRNWKTLHKRLAIREFYI